MSTQGRQENFSLSALCGIEAYRLDFDCSEWDLCDGSLFHCTESATAKSAFTWSLKPIKSSHYLI